MGILQCFPVLGTRDTDRRRINEGQCPWCPITEKCCKDIVVIWIFRQTTGILSFIQDLEKNDPLFATHCNTTYIHIFTFKGQLISE